MADPLAGILQRLGGAVQVAGADQPDEAVAQILPLHQHEDHHHDDDAAGRQWLDQRPDDGLQHLERLQLRLDHLHRQWLHLRGVGCAGRVGVRRRVVVAPDLGAQPFQEPRDAVDDAFADIGVLDDAHLGLDVGLVERQVLGQHAELGRHDGAEKRDRGEGGDNHGDDRHWPRQAEFAQPRNHRRQCEGQQHGHRKRQEDVLAEVKCCNRCRDSDQGWIGNGGRMRL